MTTNERIRYGKHVQEAIGGTDWIEGRELRKRLNAGRWWFLRWSAPAFYALMAELEDTGFVDRKIEREQVAGVTLRRHYFRVVR